MEKHDYTSRLNDIQAKIIFNKKGTKEINSSNVFTLPFVVFLVNVLVNRFVVKHFMPMIKDKIVAKHAYK